MKLYELKSYVIMTNLYFSTGISGYPAGYSVIGKIINRISGIRPSPSLCNLSCLSVRLSNNQSVRKSLEWGIDIIKPFEKVTWRGKKLLGVGKWLEWGIES